MRSGWTGLVALGCFIIIGLSSAPFIRKRYYEIFQLLHLLMYRKFEIESLLFACQVAYH